MDARYTYTLLCQAMCQLKLDPCAYVYRMSQLEDYYRILAYGTDRGGLSRKLWTENPSLGVLHEDVIIASTLKDLELDCQLENGTLVDKLRITKDPLLLVYKEKDLKFLKKESHGADEANQGRHFQFTGNRLEALALIFEIGNRNLVLRWAV